MLAAAGSSLLPFLSICSRLFQNFASVILCRMFGFSPSLPYFLQADCKVFDWIPIFVPVIDFFIFIL